MGLMATVEIGPVEETLFAYYGNTASNTIFGTANEVFSRGSEKAGELREEIEELSNELSNMVDPDESDVEAITEKINELRERIEEIHEGCDAGEETALNEVEDILNSPSDVYSIDGAYRAFENAFYSTINSQCPVRTGYLRASCTCFLYGETVICLAFAPYAQYVEYGTSRMSAQPFFEDAVKNGIEAMKPILRQLQDDAEDNAMTDGRTGAQRVQYSASAESPDLSSVIGGVAGFIIGLIMYSIIGLVKALMDELFDFMDSYDIEII